MSENKKLKFWKNWLIVVGAAFILFGIYLVPVHKLDCRFKI